MKVLQYSGFPELGRRLNRKCGSHMVVESKAAFSRRLSLVGPLTALSIYFSDPYRSRRQGLLRAASVEESQDKKRPAGRGGWDRTASGPFWAQGSKRWDTLDGTIL